MILTSVEIEFNSVFNGGGFKGGNLAVILGIDPGSRLTGWGLVESSSRHSDLVCLGQGVIEINEKWPLSDRLGVLLEELESLVRIHKPDAFSVEKVFFGKNADSAFKLGQARGVVLAVAGRHKRPVFEYATRSAKKMLTGYGAATKEQVQMIVQSLLRVRETRLDATDALALAVCHARHAEIKGVLEL